MGLRTTARPSDGKKLLVRLRGEGGFTMVEAVVAIAILAVASLGAAQSLTFGLRTSGMSRERLAARAVADREMENARSLNYDSLVLDDSAPLLHSSDPTNPDYWIDETAQTYDPDQSDPALPPEAIVRVAGASPALHHFQNPVVTGNTTFSTFMYVTWVDSPADGLVGVGIGDANTGGNDAAGLDQKRLTVVVTWTDPMRGGLTSIAQSSLFSDGQIYYHQPDSNQPPTVSCPTTTVSGLTVTFTANAADSDGTVVSYLWTFGDGTPNGTGSSVVHTYADATGSPYPNTTSVTDNEGASADNATLNCTVPVTPPVDGNGGPDGSISILNGAAYTNIVSVTLNISSGAIPLPVSMQFSNDGVTWSALQPYSTSSIWTLTSGDGLKTVYARFFDSGGLYGSQASDQITLDQTPPGAPTGLSFTTLTQGVNKTINLSWNPPSPATDVAGYRVWQRDTSGVTWNQVTCVAPVTCTLTTLSETVKKQLNYEFYVVAYDLAGNTSAQSNHVTA
jgi:type II secretory pathway pseudopilin PulG